MLLDQYSHYVYVSLLINKDHKNMCMEMVKWRSNRLPEFPILAQWTKFAVKNCLLVYQSAKWYHYSCAVYFNECLWKAKKWYFYPGHQVTYFCKWSMLPVCGILLMVRQIWAFLDIEINFNSIMSGNYWKSLVLNSIPHSKFSRVYRI